MLVDHGCLLDGTESGQVQVKDLFGLQCHILAASISYTHKRMLNPVARRVQGKKCGAVNSMETSFGCLTYFVR
jgi:hypothetical protein